METQKYSVNQHLIEIVLTWVKSGEIAIPEIQRPFVWDKTKVRNLIDSLYKGYPIGYLIAWRNPSTRLKDGTSAEGKKILIDGQQRITAMSAAILGESVIDTDYKKIKIQIAFHPIEERFEVCNPAIEKDASWIPDISQVIQGSGLLKLFHDYTAQNPNSDETVVETSLEKLRNIVKRQIGMIDLAGELDIETVTEIFVRINSEGVVLSQADFAMSRIAATEKHDGPRLRKFVDYFCHLCIHPEFYSQIAEVDDSFVKSDYFTHLDWLKKENDDLYDPDYKDMLRVAFTTEFERGKLSDFVALLSGRNFEARTYEEKIVADTFKRLKNILIDFASETNLKRFLMIIRSTGFVDKALIRSKNTLNFAYIVYLKLRSLNYSPEKIERFVRKWFVLSILTGRYSGSPESQMDFDIKAIKEKTFEKYLEDVEKAELSEAFWSASLVQKLNTSVASSPYFNVYLASQVKAKDKGFLSRDITVADLITHRGDIHHIFPRNLLKKNGLERGKYNQIANYVYMQSETNIKIGDKEPKKYFSEILSNIENGNMAYGAITDKMDFDNNLKENCIPQEIIEYKTGDYEVFLEKRRKLIAEKIEKYYKGL